MIQVSTFRGRKVLKKKNWATGFAWLMMALNGCDLFQSQSDVSRVAGQLDTAYVWPLASGNANGHSWKNAYPRLELALQNQKATVILIAEGKYVGMRDSLGIRHAFTMQAGAKWLGGYCQASLLSSGVWERDAEACPSILDAAANPSEIVEVGELPPDDPFKRPAGPVVWGAPGATLDGLTIRNGFTYGDGGGFYAEDAGQITLQNCTFENNYSLFDGGGLAARNTNVTLLQCRFLKNGSRADGGGFYVSEGSTASSTHVSLCIFKNNYASRAGGGGSITSTRAQFDRCQFYSNKTGFSGGALSLYASQVSVKTSVFSGNFARQTGGALDAFNSQTTLQNSVLFQNQALAFGGGVALSGGSFQSRFCTFAQNAALQGIAIAGLGNDNDTVTAKLQIEKCLLWERDENQIPAVPVNTARSIDIKAENNFFSGDSGVSPASSATPFRDEGNPWGEDSVPLTSDDGLIPRASVLIKTFPVEDSLLLDIRGMRRRSLTAPGAYEVSF